MLNVKILCVGSLKESYLREAVAEYAKRLGAFCNLEILELKEHKLPDNPSAAEIDAALAEEAVRMEKLVPGRAYRVALCVEGVKMSSEQFADKLTSVANEAGTICFIIGSSFGLAPFLKAGSDLRLSVSDMTFPHQLMRVMLLEIIYRCLNIQKGTKYHK